MQTPPLHLALVAFMKKGPPLKSSRPLSFRHASCGVSPNKIESRPASISTSSRCPPNRPLARSCLPPSPHREDPHQFDGPLACWCLHLQDYPCFSDRAVLAGVTPMLAATAACVTRSQGKPPPRSHGPSRSLPSQHPRACPAPSSPLPTAPPRRCTRPLPPPPVHLASFSLAAHTSRRLTLLPFLSPGSSCKEVVGEESLGRSRRSGDKGAGRPGSSSVERSTATTKARECGAELRRGAMSGAAGNSDIFFNTQN
jgi:hypothetical protein